MANPILCSIGRATTTSARVNVVAPGGVRAARLAFRQGDGPVTSCDASLREADPVSLGSFDLENLEPSAEITYAVDVGEESELVGAQTILEERNVARFRLLPSGRPLRVGLLSCNGGQTVARDRRYAMWSRLGERVAAGDVDLLVHAGDQIYADALKERFELRADPPEPEELRRAYRTWIVDTWSASPVRRVLASCPSLMMWDDHDIYDGWGSNDDDGGPEARAFFDAARTAFADFQAPNNPSPIDAGSFATGMTTGEVGILLVDGRTHRHYASGTIVGTSQWEAIDRWLDDVRGRSLRHLFVVVGVPVAHLRVAFDLWIRELVPWTDATTDDLRDAWVAKENRAEAEHLVTRLFDFQAASPTTRVSILAGDVHVATLGRLTSSSAAHAAAPVVHQIVSSAIGYAPPSGIPLLLLRRATRKTIDVAPGVTGELLDLAGVDTDRVLARRNFAILRLDGPDGGWHPDAEIRVELHAEGIDEPHVQRLPRE